MAEGDGLLLMTRFGQMDFGAPLGVRGCLSYLGDSGLPPARICIVCVHGGRPSQSLQGRKLIHQTPIFGLKHNSRHAHPRFGFIASRAVHSFG